MGFSGGGSNVLLPHTHDGRVSQDGGPLNFSNITQSGSAAGEVFYSDGTALQQLVYPAVPAGETLTASALSTAPAWVAGAAATSTWTELASVSVTNSALSSGTITAMTQLDVWIKSANTASQNTAMTFNNTASSYNNNQWVDSTLATAAGTSEIPIYGANTSNETFIHMSIFNPSSGVIGYTWTGSNFSDGAGGTPLYLAGNGYSYGSQVTRIDRTLYGGSAQNQTGRMVVFGAN
jgi:hypothetical protein